MKLEVSISEMKQIINEITRHPAGIFAMIREDVRKNVGDYLTELMEIELTHHLGRGYYERGKAGGNVNHRNGTYIRTFGIKGIGEVEIRVPRDRRGEFHSSVIPKGKRYEEVIKEELSLLFLTGISTRSLSMLSEKLLGVKVSSSEVSRANGRLIKAVEAWRRRDLSKETITYLFIDGVTFPMRIAGSVERVPVLVVIGVTEEGHKKVLGFQSGDKESAGSWREFFKDLKGRGLDGSKVILGVMDGLPGLEKVFVEEFPHAKVQRCQVHVARNVLAKVPKKVKQEVADELRSIFYASTKEKALVFFKGFKQRWGREIPSAVRCLENTLESCLTFYRYPREEWISLRTTNIIERLNKEYKRRTKAMEIVAGENACYMLLAFISLKMELHWRSNPLGKVRPNLPFFQKLENGKNEFTQNT